MKITGWILMLFYGGPMIDPAIKYLALVGPTASGKTALAVDLAEQLGGEIICADSRTVYAGLDIGTAKPTAAEQARVPHHLLDVVSPQETYSAQTFKVAAEAAMADIAARGRIPLLVGGTGLYVYAVVYDYQFPAGPRTQLRVELEHQSLEDLVERLWREDPDRAAEIDLQNPRRVIRALETVGQPRQRQAPLPSNVFLGGLRRPQDVMNKNIVQRTHQMVEAGLVTEVEAVVAKYDSNLEVLKSPGYAEIIDYLRGATTLPQAEELISLHTRQLVRRQLTWFKRNPDIQWFERPDELAVRAKAFLNAV